MLTDRIKAFAYICLLRILLAWQTVINRLRGLLLFDRRAPARYHEIGDRRVAPQLRARHLIFPVVGLQSLVLLYALIYGPQAVFMAGIGTFVIVGLVMLPTTRRKA